ncbi:MAG: hypothetical protein AAFR81_05855 [Chloroflexota bacterium]
MSTEKTLHSRKQLSVDQLIRLGKAALREGDRQSAYHLWKQAAMREPDNEEVWVAMLQVLDSEADRRVCLMNIITINPNNKEAQSELDAMIGNVRGTQPIRRRLSPQRQILTTAEFQAFDEQRNQYIDVMRVIILGLILGIGTAGGTILLRFILL